MRSEIKELVQLFSRNSFICPQNPFKDRCKRCYIETAVPDTIHVPLEMLSHCSVSKASGDNSGPATAVTTFTQTHSQPSRDSPPTYKAGANLQPGGGRLLHPGMTSHGIFWESQECPTMGELTSQCSPLAIRELVANQFCPLVPCR